MRILRLVPVAVLTLLLLAACSRPEVGKEELKGKPVVDIDGVVYTTLDIAIASAHLIKEMDPSEYGNSQIRDRVLKGFITNRLLVREAERFGAVIDQKRYDEVMRQFISSEGERNLQVFSGNRELTTNMFAIQLKERLMVEQFLKKKVHELIYVSDEELKALYAEKGQTLAPNGQQAHILHIVTRDRKKADAALAELRRGIPFAEVAERHSIGPERKDGGDLGVVAAGDMPEFFAAAYALPDGATSEVVQSEYGFHIFHMVNHVAGSAVSYEAAKPFLYEELFSKKQEQKMRELTDVLHKKSTIRMLGDFSLADIAPLVRSSGDH